MLSAQHSPHSITLFNNHTPTTVLPLHPTSPLLLSHTSLHPSTLLTLFRSLSSSTTWHLTHCLPIQGAIYEPEGLVRIGSERYFVSATECTSPPTRYPNGERDKEGYDRSTGAGIAHLFVFDARERQVCDARLTAPGDDIYHAGGIEYDGKRVWAALSEYRPNSRARIVRIDSRTLSVEKVFCVRDHVGTVVKGMGEREVVRLSWGGSRAYTWDISNGCERNREEPVWVTMNPSHWIDYQGAKYVGRVEGKEFMIASGIADIGGRRGEQEKVRIGGVVIVNMESMLPLAEIPIPMVTQKGAAICKNPFDAAVVDGKLRVCFLPDERSAELYVYEPE